MPTLRNSIDVHTNVDGTYDFRIIAVENGNILCASHQGYAHVYEAIDMAHRVASGQVDPILTFSKETP